MYKSACMVMNTYCALTKCVKSTHSKEVVKALLIRKNAVCSPFFH